LPQEPHRDEQKSAALWLSPGLVRSKEVLLRTILDPDHLKEDGKLASAAIALDDIRFRGWSVDRKALTSLWKLKKAHSAWKTRKPNVRNIYVLPIPVGEIRTPNPATGEQEFVAIDAAMWLNPAHAAVLLSKPQSEGAARGLRNVLLKKLPQYVSLNDAFNPQRNYGYKIGLLLQFVAILVSPVRYILQLLKK
jgi:hypothetical protein